MLIDLLIKIMLNFIRKIKKTIRKKIISRLTSIQHL